MTSPQGSPHAALANAVAAVLSAPGRHKAAAMLDLRVEVGVAARRMRDEGLPPDAIVDELQREVREVIARKWFSYRRDDHDDQLVGEVSGWALDEYFRRVVDDGAAPPGEQGR
jgi:hypothetical protein